jgi:hypothetical protein
MRKEYNLKKLKAKRRGMLPGLCCGDNRLSPRVTDMLPIHPGRILKRELAARDLSANRLAPGLRVPSGRITGILHPWSRASMQSCPSP